MKIYIVSHYYDNGKTFEEYREYVEHKFYSTYQLGLRAFNASIENNYDGKFVLTECKLDTQERRCLKESNWANCEFYDSIEWEQWQGYYKSYYEAYDYSPDPADSYEAYWRWEDLCCPVTEEDKAWLEYFTTPGTNYREWEECERELKEKRIALLLEKLTTLLKEMKIV